MAEPDLPTTVIAHLEQMLSEAIKIEPDWAQIAEWAREVETVSNQLSA